MANFARLALVALLFRASGLNFAAVRSVRLCSEDALRPRLTETIFLRFA